MVRQYFPKGTDFFKLAAADVQRVEGLLNNRPRKHSIIIYQTRSSPNSQPRPPFGFASVTASLYLTSKVGLILLQNF